MRRRATGQAINRGSRQPLVSNEDLVAEMKQVLASSSQKSFHGQGYRKVWARLRHRGMRADKERVRHLMGTYELFAPKRNGKPRGPQLHDGTIIPNAPNVMWGTDAMATWTLRQGQV